MRIKKIILLEDFKRMNEGLQSDLKKYKKKKLNKNNKKKSLNKILKPINPKMMILIMALMKMKYNEHLFIKVN